MLIYVFLILGVPLALACLAFLAGKSFFAAFSRMNSAGYFVVLCASALLLKDILISGPVWRFGALYLDALSGFFICIISIVSFASSLYSTGYVRKDIAEGRVSDKKASMYYVLFNLFCCSMFCVPMLNNLGLLWVAIEMTTLVSAFLVGFYNRKESVEAAWKYIIICSVGIIFALLGTILFSYAYSLAGLGRSLYWTDAVAVAPFMDAGILKIAFIFVLVGYGTKAGFAPMHTWLPDAHSQAVSPISALLSGVLLKTSLYAVLRFGMVMIRAGELSYFANLMTLFGMASLVISSGFVIVQKDIKRLLAYSSIEHMGIISLAFGLATPLAFAAGLFHAFNHAVTKSFMFFGAGNIVHAFRKGNMNAIRGVIKILPFTGVMVLLGVFALAGFPPFPVFFSEILILTAAFLKGSYLTGSLLLLFLGIVFAAFIYHFGKMLYGNAPKGMPEGMGSEREDTAGKIAFLFLLVLMLSASAGFMLLKEDVLCIVQKLFLI